MKRSDFDKMEKVDFSESKGKFITLPICKNYENKPFYFEVLDYKPIYNRAELVIISTEGMYFLASFNEFKASLNN